VYVRLEGSRKRYSLGGPFVSDSLAHPSQELVHGILRWNILPPASYVIIFKKSYSIQTKCVLVCENIMEHWKKKSKTVINLDR